MANLIAHHLVGEFEYSKSSLFCWFSYFFFFLLLLFLPISVVFDLAPRWGEIEIVLQLASERSLPPPHSFVSRFRSISVPSKLTVNYQQRTHTSHANGSISSEIFIQDNYFFSFFLPSKLLDANNRLSYVCCCNFLKVSAHYFFAVQQFNNIGISSARDNSLSADDHITSLLLPWIRVMSYCFGW